MKAALQAPFPYFGGKRKVAASVWQRFGDPQNYVEPFAGSLAVLLGRPSEAKVETVNDLDGFLSNAWRAIRLDPEGVAVEADQPVVEADLHARHVYLNTQRETLTQRLMADHEYFDTRLAAWWIWGTSCWIGSGFCEGSGPWVVKDGLLVKQNKEERSKESGIKKAIPYLASNGQGIKKQMPFLGHAGRGVKGVNKRSELIPWMEALSDRLKRARITCGNWDRIVGPSVTCKLGMTAVFLDPPYFAENMQADLYSAGAEEAANIAARDWAIENGDNPLLRVAFCGYSDEHEFPDTWEAMPWQAPKGYQKVIDGQHGGQREMVWFSPHCLKPQEGAIPLFGGIS